MKEQKGNAEATITVLRVCFNAIKLDTDNWEFECWKTDFIAIYIILFTVLMTMKCDITDE